MFQLADLQEVLTIDGGFSTQSRFHHPKDFEGDELWTSRLNVIDPDAVIKTHLDFMRAGAQIIITNTYQSSLGGLLRYAWMTEYLGRKHIKFTVGLAHKARDQFMEERPAARRPWIMGSIGPYGACLNDGSEFTGAYADNMDADAFIDWHRDRVNAIVAEGVDGLAVETIPCRREAMALCELITKEHPTVPFWVSFQCKCPTYLAYSSDIFSIAAQDVWQKVNGDADSGQLLAVGVNCTDPRFVSSLIAQVNDGRRPGKPIPTVVYPNSGEIYSSLDGWMGPKDPKPVWEYVADWKKLGARYIGSCCRTHAQHTKRIRQKLDELSVPASPIAPPPEPRPSTAP